MQGVLDTLWHHTRNLSLPYVPALEVAPSATTFNSSAPTPGLHLGPEVSPVLLAPVEILSLVASYMDTPSLRNMRLASKSFEKAVSASQG